MFVASGQRYDYISPVAVDSNAAQRPVVVRWLKRQASDANMTITAIRPWLWQKKFGPSEPERKSDPQTSVVFVLLSLLLSTRLVQVVYVQLVNLVKWLPTLCSAGVVLVEKHAGLLERVNRVIYVTHSASTNPITLHPTPTFGRTVVFDI
ncbi:hypothetical protein AG1IA_06647 [Rhizoctonia solani AG-1 IA]|uniref:Uncharacterized protein n=1 Tax=Thanatephorus cucumeris (strain AG1-IA) TaxID=983506 RepID=L8WRC0_THACA|nr:hypothetical protein AG1IA_06647 [Rhizoctonia solani AG-1 IA]